MTFNEKLKDTRDEIRSNYKEQLNITDKIYGRISDCETLNELQYWVNPKNTEAERLKELEEELEEKIMKFAFLLDTIEKSNVGDNEYFL